MHNSMFHVTLFFNISQSKLDLRVNIKMIPLYLFFLYSGLTAESDVQQPSMLWKKQNENATIKCQHTKGGSYYQMYWYRQLPGETMKQIVFTVANSKPDFQPEFSGEKFSVTKPDAISGTLTVKKLVPGDKGLYFCAVSEHSDTNHLEA